MNIGKTYFEATGEGYYALHAGEEDMVFLPYLLNSIANYRAPIIRYVIEQELRSHYRVKLNRNERIILCMVFGGNEHVRDGTLVTNTNAFHKKLS